VTQRALEISAADLVVLALPAGDGSQLVIEHAAGDRQEAALGLVLPAAGSLSGQVLGSGEPVSVRDFTHDSRAAQAARDRLHLGPAVLVPLGSRGNVRGVLTAGRKPGSPPLPLTAVEVLTAFAGQAGVGLELAEHRHEAERYALIEDRERIARDLHDLVIQRLYATGLSLQGVSARIGDSETGRRVSSAVDALDETIKDIRSAIFSLHAGAIPGESLRARILSAVEEAAATLGFAPRLQMAGLLDSRVPDSAGEHLLSALREALSNAARHSGASQVSVAVEAGSMLVLTVRDNGTGIRETRRRSGLANMEERAAGLGGTMLTRPAHGGGTEVEWRVPLQ
jgi:signal transduction histidine kinase